ncbi:MAG TPA: hypothetical protein VI111_02130, partial [Thermoleophilaceae bacterium]
WVREESEQGPVLLEQIRGFSEIPLVFYVGDVTPERRAQAARLGAVAVTKTPDELLRFVLVELSTAGA